MRVLVTGATGFLGSHLVKALLHDGHDVHILKRRDSNCWRLADVQSELYSHNREETKIDRLFQEGGGYDAVMHAATSYGRNGESYRAVLEANVALPLQLLEACIRYETPLFFNTDTFSNTAQGSIERLIGYHLTKRHFLEWGQHLVKMASIRFVNMRLEHLYGPADSPDKFIPYVVKSCLENHMELQLTAGEQKRDFIHVQDAVRAYVLMLRQGVKMPTSFSEFQVGSGTATPIKTLVHSIHAMTGSTTCLCFGALPYPPQEIMHSQADVEPLQRYGWHSQISLEEGLLSVIEEQGGGKHDHFQK